MNSMVGVGSIPRALTAGAGRASAPRPSSSAMLQALGVERCVSSRLSPPSMNATSALSAGAQPRSRRSPARQHTAGSINAPVASSTMVSTRARISAAGSDRSSRACRGAPASGRAFPSAAVLASKSASQSSPSGLSSRFAGFTSPCTSPAPCTRASALAAAAPTALTSPSGRGPRSCRTSASEHTARASSSSPASPRPAMLTIPGPRTASRAAASRSELSLDAPTLENRSTPSDMNCHHIYGCRTSTGAESEQQRRGR